VLRICEADKNVSVSGGNQTHQQQHYIPWLLERWSKGKYNQCNGTAYTLKKANSCWNAKIAFYVETFGGQNSNLY